MQRKRTVGFSSRSAVNTPNPASEKVDFIRKGKKRRPSLDLKKIKMPLKAKVINLWLLKKRKNSKKQE